MRDQGMRAHVQVEGARAWVHADKPVDVHSLGPTNATERRLSHMGHVNVNVFSLGLSNATEEQQVYSAIWDMPMLQGVCTSTGCS